MTPLGASGGRSRANRTGQGARRRATPRERELVDPPWDDPWVVPSRSLKALSWLTLALVTLLLVVAAVGLF